jgi:hypothetical protein
MPDTATGVPAAPVGDPAGVATALLLMAAADPAYVTAPAEPVPEPVPSGPVGDAAPPPYHVGLVPVPDAQAEHDDLVGKLTGKDDEHGQDSEPRTARPAGRRGITNA